MFFYQCKYTSIYCASQYLIIAIFCAQATCTYLCCVVMSYGPTIEVASHKVACHYAGIEQQHSGKIFGKEIHRHGEIIEHIGHAVWKSAYYEQRHAEKQRQKFALARPFHGCGHDETASYGKHSALHISGIEACLEYALRCFLQRHGRHSRHQRHQQASHYVHAQNGT